MTKASVWTYQILTSFSSLCIQSSNRHNRSYRRTNKCPKGIRRCASEDSLDDVVLSTGEDNDDKTPTLSPINLGGHGVPTASPIKLDEHPVPDSTSDDHAETDDGSNTDDGDKDDDPENPPLGDDDKPSDDVPPGDDEPPTGPPAEPPVEPPADDTPPEDDDGNDPSNDDIDYEELDDDEEPPSNDGLNLDDWDRNGGGNSSIPIDDPDVFVTNEDYPIEGEAEDHDDDHL